MATKKSKSKKNSKKKAAKKGARREAAPRKQATLSKRTVRGKNKARPQKELLDNPANEPEELTPRAGGQSGSLQGLSDVPDADSETVDELLEEGNAFEAGVIKGVEDAPDADEGEVRTHEVPEDDVPEEYLDDEDR